MGISGTSVFAFGGGGLDALEADLDGDLSGVRPARVSRGCDREGVSNSFLLPVPGIVLGVCGKADGRRGVPFMACCGCRSWRKMGDVVRVRCWPF